MKIIRFRRPSPQVLFYLPWVLGIVVCLALFNGALDHRGNSLDDLNLLSTCNLRLLDSVRSWKEMGFWQLGGLMSFRDSLTPLPPPTDLYSSQSTLYVVPHFFAYQFGGAAAFWQMIRTSIYTAAGAMAAAVATLSWLITEERVHQAKAPRFMLGLVLFASFTATFPSEGLWGGIWNSDDRALSSVLLALASANLALAVRFHQVFWHRITAFLLVTAAIGCPRMGVMTAITVLIGRYGFARRDRAVKAIMSWPMALSLLGASAVHYIRVGLVDLTGRYVLGGSALLDRFGLIHKMRGKGQSDLDYESVWQAFGLFWRQSELMIRGNWRLRGIENVEHLLFYLLAAAGLCLLLWQMHRGSSVYLAPVSLISAPPLIWGVLINQSVAEHPDIHAITWVVPLSLGLVVLLERIVQSARNRFGVFWAVVVGAWIAYWFFLWQVQYFLRSYPGLRGGYPA